MTRTTIYRWMGIAAFGLLLTTSFAAADIPGHMPIQGNLSDGDGTPINKPTLITFRLYGEQSGGRALFTESISVPVNEGVFTVYLGSGSGLDLNIFRDNAEIFLGIQVESDQEMTPRLALGITPYAALADSARDSDTLAGKSADAFAGKEHTHVVGKNVHTHGFADLQSVPQDLVDGDSDKLMSLPCGTGQIAKSAGGSWTCGNDNDSFGALPCQHGQIPIKNGSGWVCGNLPVQTAHTPRIPCNWEGTRWASSGIDGHCAHLSGTRITCSGGFVTEMTYTEDCGVYE